MISDVLHDAVVEIERYQGDGLYDGENAFLRPVKILMDATRLNYDFSPGDPTLDRLRNALRDEIKALDLSKVLAARDQFYAEVERRRLNRRALDDNGSNAN